MSMQRTFLLLAAMTMAAGAAATTSAPVAHVSYELSEGGRSDGRMDVTLESWPDGGRTLLATCGPHGDDIEWFGDHPG